MTSIDELTIDLASIPKDYRFVRLVFKPTEVGQVLFGEAMTADGRGQNGVKLFPVRCIPVSVVHYGGVT